MNHRNPPPGHLLDHAPPIRRRNEDLLGPVEARPELEDFPVRPHVGEAPPDVDEHPDRPPAGALFEQGDPLGHVFRKVRLLDEGQARLLDFFLQKNAPAFGQSSSAVPPAAEGQGRRLDVQDARAAQAIGHLEPGPAGIVGSPAGRAQGNDQARFDSPGRGRAEGRQNQARERPRGADGGHIPPSGARFPEHPDEGPGDERIRRRPLGFKPSGGRRDRRILPADQARPVDVGERIDRRAGRLPAFPEGGDRPGHQGGRPAGFLVRPRRGERGQKIKKRPESQAPEAEPSQNARPRPAGFHFFPRRRFGPRLVPHGPVRKGR